MQRQTASSGTPWEDKVGYSRVVRAGQFVYVSGTVAADEAGAIQHVGDLYGQSAYILRKIETALMAVGANLTDVVRIRAYVVNMDDYEQFAKAHHEFFAHIRPANTLVEVSRLATPDVLVEIEADAIVSES
ncbi:MAG: RidA family protein [Synechococcales bacterium]|nr:RidA family protein [Synechococcales bacterium]